MEFKYINRIIKWVMKMNNKGITLVETLLTITIVSLTSIVVIGILTINRHLLAKPNYYLKYLNEALSVRLVLTPLNRMKIYEKNIDIIEDGDDWIVYQNEKVIIEYKNNILYNYIHGYNYELKYSKIKIKKENEYMAFILDDNNFNRCLYIKWDND